MVRQRIGKIAAQIDAKIASVAAEIVSLGLDAVVVNDLATFVRDRVDPCVTSVTK